MVSRRRILSMSPQRYEMPEAEEEEDVWYHKEELFKDHIQEVLNKWTQIDDEIWAKVIVLEKNRRLAKAYARAPVLTVNGSEDGFDGFRIGLCGFDNPLRDQRTADLKRHIGYGVKIKMDDAGNILIKRVSSCNIYIKSTGDMDENAIGNDIIKQPGCALEPEKAYKLFDMKKFHSNINRELRSAYPDRRRLQYQCLSAIAFVKAEQELLECPVWVLIINIVAMDMLKSKLPPFPRVMDIRNRPRIPVPDEDPYSVAGNGDVNELYGCSTGMGGKGDRMGPSRDIYSHRNRGDKPPKLPPRENMYPRHIPKPDYYDSEEVKKSKSKPSSKRKDKSSKEHKYEDLYYCGLRARVSKPKTQEPPETPHRYATSSQQPPAQVMAQHHHHQQQQHRYLYNPQQNYIRSVADLIQPTKIYR